MPWKTFNLQSHVILGVFLPKLWALKRANTGKIFHLLVISRFLLEWYHTGKLGVRVMFWTINPFAWVQMYAQIYAQIHVQIYTIECLCRMQDSTCSHWQCDICKKNCANKYVQIDVQIYLQVQIYAYRYLRAGCRRAELNLFPLAIWQNTLLINHQVRILMTMMIEVLILMISSLITGVSFS